MLKTHEGSVHFTAIWPTNINCLLHCISAFIPFYRVVQTHAATDTHPQFFLPSVTPACTNKANIHTHTHTHTHTHPFHLLPLTSCYPFPFKTQTHPMCDPLFAIYHLVPNEIKLFFEVEP